MEVSTITETIYADILLLVNFSMDYLCLYISGKILHRAISLKKLLLASALGAVYSVISLLLPLSSVIMFFLDILMCFIMTTIVFHAKKQFGKTLLAAFLYFFVSMAIGGIMTALFNLLNKLELPFDGIESDGLSVWGFAILAIIGGVASVFGGGLIFKKKEIEECLLEITFDGKTQAFHAISDSGNLLVDAISGKPVIIIDETIAVDIVDISIIKDFLAGIHPKNPSYSSMSIAPVNTVSGSSTLVLLKPQKLSVTYQKNGKSHTFSPNALFALGNVGRHQAIIPYSVFRG